MEYNNNILEPKQTEQRIYRNQFGGNEQKRINFFSNAQNGMDLEYIVAKTDVITYMQTKWNENGK